MAKVINFVGADHKVGVTMTVQSIADCLGARAPEMKILVLHLDGHEGTDYITEPGKSMDLLFASLMSSMTEYSEIENLLFRNKNVSVLTGVRDNNKAVRFTPESVDFLLDLCRPYYDLILIDSGAALDHSGLSVGAFKYSDKNVLITTQNAATFRTFLQYKPEVYDRLDYKVDYLVINKFSWSLGKFLATQEQLQRSLGFEESFPIEGLTPDIAYQAEYGKKSLYFYRSAREYKKDITQLIDWLGLLTKETDKE